MIHFRAFVIKCPEIIYNKTPRERTDVVTFEIEHLLNNTTSHDYFEYAHSGMLLSGRIRFMI